MNRFPKGARDGLGEWWNIARIIRSERKKIRRALFAVPELRRAFHEVGKRTKQRGGELSMIQKQNKYWRWEHPQE